MKLKVTSSSCIDFKEEAGTEAAPAAAVDTRYDDPNWDPLALWTLSTAPSKVSQGYYVIDSVTKATLSDTVDILVSAGVQALECVRKGPDAWEIHYYE